jgi:hypothetical protein
MTHHVCACLRAINHDPCRRDGFFLARDILDPVLCARCRELMWSANEIPRLATDPAGPLTAEEAAMTRADGNSASGYRWYTRGLGSERAFVELLPQNPHIKAIADQLLGEGEVEEIQSTSGVCESSQQQAQT